MLKRGLGTFSKWASSYLSKNKGLSWGLATYGRSAAFGAGINLSIGLGRKIMGDNDVSVAGSLLSGALLGGGIKAGMRTANGGLRSIYSTGRFSLSHMRELSKSGIGKHAFGSVFSRKDAMSLARRRASPNF